MILGILYSLTNNNYLNSALSTPIFDAKTFSGIYLQSEKQNLWRFGAETFLTLLNSTLKFPLNIVKILYSKFSKLDFLFWKLNLFLK